MQVFGSSGTRGVAGEELTPGFVLRLASAAASVFEADRVALGRDTRTTGAMFADAAAAGLVGAGVTVDRLGVVPTPTLVRYCDTEGVPGLVITASHNPPEYNGVKLVGSDGHELPVDQLEAVEETLLDDEPHAASWETVGESQRVETANDDYIADLLTAVDTTLISDAELTVALDPGHGAGSLTSPEFFRRLGCTVVTVNAQPDGRFPGRQPEPIPEHLHDLQRLVRSSDADLGVAHDGDADRAVFIDERGEYIEGDASLAALAATVLDPDDTTVSAVNVSQRLVDVCQSTGADLELTPIGSTNIITRVRELWDAGESVPIAGEGNGGIFFPEYRLVRDGAFTAAKFLELAAERPVSEIVEPYTNYHNVRLNLSYETERELDAMLAAAERYARREDVDPTTVDGYRLDYGDAWVLIRPSGTEPKVRIYAEATTQDRAHDLAEEARTPLEEARSAKRAGQS